MAIMELTLRPACAQTRVSATPASLELQNIEVEFFQAHVVMPPVHNSTLVITCPLMKVWKAASCALHIQTSMMLPHGSITGTSYQSLYGYKAHH